MKERYVFHPPRRAGLLLDTAIIIGLVFAAIFGLRGVADAEIGLTFLLYLLPVLVAAVLTPIFFYYVFALQRSYYTLRRDGISLHWGLRLEDIPIDRVEWVRLASDLSRPLPAPPLRLPGAMLGVRHDSSLGEVEFLASRASGMVLVHTPARSFAISPEDPKAFLQAYRQLSEYGSLTPMPARSQFPGFLLARLWSDPPARGLILASLLLSLALLAWVSLAIPAHASVAFGVTASGTPRDLVPAVRLLLLPVLNGLLVLADLLVGVIYFRNEANRPLAYLVWGFAVLSPLLFLVSVGFIL